MGRMLIMGSSASCGRTVLGVECCVLSWILEIEMVNLI